MGFVKMLIELPLLAAVIVFAFINNEMVTFDLWPFFLKADVSLSVAIVLLLLLGYIVGKLDSWLSYAPLRRALRTQLKQNKKLNKEHQKLAETVVGLKEDLKSSRAEAEKAKPEAPTAPRPSFKQRLQQKFSGLFRKKPAPKDDFWML